MSNQKPKQTNKTPDPALKPLPPAPVAEPAPDPTAAPAPDPTSAPALDPTAAPVADPTAAPVADPTAAPVADPLTGPAQPANIATLVEPPKPLPTEKGKGYRKLSDYAALDWSKSNSELAKIAGVSRQRIAQIRAQLANDSDGNTTETDDNETVSEVTPTPAIAKAETDYKLLAETTFDMSAGLLSMIVGPEWQPRILEVNGQQINERDIVCKSLAKYFEAKQMPDLPPGVMLAFVVCSYSAPRFAVPNTSNKFKLTFLWCKTKVSGLLSGLRRRKKPQQHPENAIPLPNEN